MKGGIGNLMKQAQQLQANMQKAQAEIAAHGGHRRVRRRHGQGHDERPARGEARADRPVRFRSTIARCSKTSSPRRSTTPRSSVEAAIAAEDVRRHGRHEPAAGLEAAVLTASSRTAHAVSAVAQPADRGAALPAGRRAEVRAAHGVPPARARPRRRRARSPPRSAPRSRRSATAGAAACSPKASCARSAPARAATARCSASSSRRRTWSRSSSPAATAAATSC